MDGNLQSLSEQEKCASTLQGANIKEWRLGAAMVWVNCDPSNAMIVIVQVTLKPWHLSQLDMATDVFHQSTKKLQRGNNTLLIWLMILSVGH